MSYKRAIEQLRPVRYPKQDVQEKTQRYLHESKGPSGAQWESLISMGFNLHTTGVKNWGTITYHKNLGIDEKTFEGMFIGLKEVDLSGVVEVIDNTNLTGELACAGGACEIT